MVKEGILRKMVVPPTIPIDRQRVVFGNPNIEGKHVFTNTFALGAN